MLLKSFKRGKLMKSFAIGLALLISGFALYSISSAVNSLSSFASGSVLIFQKMAEAGTLPAGVALPTGLASASLGIPKDIMDMVPYLAIAVMAFGVLWFWVIEPLLLLSAPPKRREASPVSQPQYAQPQHPQYAQAQHAPPPPMQRPTQMPPRAAPPPPPPLPVAPPPPQGRNMEQWIQEAIREKAEREQRGGR
jgi:hypothetical protein